MVSANDLYGLAPPWLQTVMLNAYAYRIERHRYGRPYRKRLELLLESECWDPERMREYQNDRVRFMTRYAYDKSPFYRERFDAAGVRPDDIRGTNCLERLPLLTKEDIRERGAQLQTRRKPERGWLHGHTSGTTGTPLGLWYDRDLCILNNALDARQKRWGGMKDGDWLGLLLGRVIVPIEQQRGPFWRRNRIQRQVWFSSFHLSEENLPLYIDEIRRSELQFIEGYPSTLFILANHLKSRGETLPIRAVFTSSETLHGVHRETIEAAFECGVFDFYGLAERVLFASECRAHAGRHLAEEFGFTEIVDGEGRRVAPGQPGYLVGTSLHNTAMPMLRYRTSDVSSIETAPCSCGRALPRISDVTTKAEDIIVTPDGRMIAPSILTHPFKPFDQIVQSQLVQDTADTLRVRIVPSSRFGEEEQRSLLRSLQERLGPEMRIDLELTNEIPREKSGKYRWVISRVDHSNLVNWESSPPEE
jgi:phenylacetate-CoA ligase